MRKKLNSESGLTLVEMLAVVVILILLGLLLNTGLQMAMSTYRAIVAQSEVELLLSTAVDAISDDLRYARNVAEDGAGGFTYTSDSFGADAALGLNSDGQIVAMVGGEAKRLLSTGAYGLNGAYRVENMKISYTQPNFTIELTVATKDGAISAQTPDKGVTVRCLNAKKDTTGG